jgi:hypothetical protein
MTSQIELKPETIARLKSFAEPLVDTFDSVVNRALDALEAQSKADPSQRQPRVLNPGSPPSLAYTTVHSIVLNGKRFPAAETYWNHLMFAVIREAAKRFPPKKLDEIVICNHVMGKREDSGYRWLEDAGISVQGQDANGAWATTAHILPLLRLPVEVEFSWQNNPKAASPGERAAFRIMAASPGGPPPPGMNAAGGNLPPGGASPPLGYPSLPPGAVLPGLPGSRDRN